MQGIPLITAGVLCAVGGPFSAFANDTLPDTQPSAENGPILLQAGDRAPFHGVLMPIGLASSLGAQVEGCEARIELAQEEAREVAQLELDLVVNLRSNDREAHKLQLEILEQALWEAEPGWQDHPILWFGVGIASTIAILAGSVSILGAIAPVSVNLR